MTDIKMIIIIISNRNLIEHYKQNRESTEGIKREKSSKYTGSGNLVSTIGA